MTWTSFSTGSLINKDIQGLSYHVYRVFIIYIYHICIYIYRGSQCGHPRKLHNCRRVSRTDNPRGWLMLHAPARVVGVKLWEHHIHIHTHAHTHILYICIYIIYTFTFTYTHIYIYIIHINRHSANRTLHTVILLANLKQSRKHLGLWAYDI